MSFLQNARMALPLLLHIPLMRVLCWKLVGAVKLSVITISTLGNVVFFATVTKVSSYVMVPLAPFWPTAIRFCGDQ